MNCWFVVYMQHVQINLLSHCIQNQKVEF